MKRIAHLLFEARSLKQLPRSGYQFLGAGSESVAEHSFSTAFIAYVMGHMVPDVDRPKLVAMALLHDLPEARIGDLNYLQRFYVKPDERAAVAEMTQGLPFGGDIDTLLDEFNRGESVEARLARDADQLALLTELANLDHLGYATPSGWMPNVCARLLTAIGREMAEAILNTPVDEWWRQKFIDRTSHSK